MPAEPRIAVKAGAEGLRPTASWLQRLGTYLLCSMLIGGAVSRAEPPSAPPELLEDAELRDVFFLDFDRGWAVGDRGVILTTHDGGRHWQLADCPINSGLESVFFIDERHGWAVGGWAHPYTHKSSGVVLRTENGGRLWTRVPAPTLPALKRVHFFDPRHGWAIGNGSMIYPTGAFRTQDGGRSWTVVPKGSRGGWVAGHFHSQQEAVLLGRNAAVSVHAAGGYVTSQLELAGLRPTRDVDIAANGRGWLVGAGGLVLVSDDRGQSWLACSTLPPAARHFDFSTLAQRGSDVWIAGTPGSCVFHSPDAGESWELLWTGQNLPIKAMQFADRDRGWLVGALGTVIATTDGGQTWSRQRGGERVALLGVFSEATTIPFEMLTRVSAAEGFLSAVEILTRRDVELPEASECSLEDRVHEAVVSVGGSAANRAWQFPLRQAGIHFAARHIVEDWSRFHSGDGLQQLEAHLVKTIRQWRPEVIITDPPSPNGQDPLAHLINQVTLSALDRAADETAYPEHISLLGLRPWQPKKLLALSQQQRSGTLTVQTSQLATRLGRSLADYSLYGRGLVHARWALPPESISFRLLTSQLPRDLAGRDFLSGVAIAPGQGPRRELGPAVGDLRSLSKAAQKQRNVQQLLERTINEQQDGAAWLGQVDDLTSGLAPLAAGHVLYQLAHRYRAMGRYNLSAETLLQLVNRHADHPMTEPALLWLLQFADSSEIQRGILRSGRPDSLPGNPSPASAVVPSRHAAEAGFAGPLNNTPQRLPTTAAATESTLAATTRAIKLGDFVRRTRPTLYADPAVRLPLAAAQRKRGMKREAQHHWQQLSTSELSVAWRQAARGELWLDDPRGYPPKPTLSCGRTREKPYLDGQLDDSCWANCASANLVSTLGEDEQWPALVYLAHDAEYLYLAVHCGKPVELVYDSSDQTRPRDADLSAQDRVELLLDVDRDYATFFSLAVDHRGWVRDSCTYDVRWNPQWYVAVAADDRSWTVEAAIPLNELTAQLESNATWAMGIQRVVPGRGFQAWTRPASVAIRPEGFGYLRFQTRRPK